MFSNVFGSKKRTKSKVMSTPSSMGPTIATLRESIERQIKREQHVEIRIQSMLEEAKTKKAKGDEGGAISAMKRSKQYKQELEKVKNVKFNFETQVISLESSSQNAATFAALQEGTAMMQRIRSEVGIENVHDIMDQVRENTDLEQEINQAISQSLDPYMSDEDELLEWIRSDADDGMNETWEETDSETW